MYLMIREQGKIPPTRIFLFNNSDLYFLRMWYIMVFGFKEKGVFVAFCFKFMESFNVSLLFFVLVVLVGSIGFCLALFAFVTSFEQVEC